MCVCVRVFFTYWVNWRKHKCPKTKLMLIGDHSCGIPKTIRKQIGFCALKNVQEIELNWMAWENLHPFDMYIYFLNCWKQYVFFSQIFILIFGIKCCLWRIERCDIENLLIWIFECFFLILNFLILNTYC